MDMGPRFLGLADMGPSALGLAGIGPSALGLANIGPSSLGLANIGPRAGTLHIVPLPVHGPQLDAVLGGRVQGSLEKERGRTEPRRKSLANWCWMFSVQRLSLAAW